MIDPLHCLRLNEARQARTMAFLATDSEQLGGGVLAYTAGTMWACKAVGVDLEEPLGVGACRDIVAWFHERGIPAVLELTTYSAEETLAAAGEAGFRLVETEGVLACDPARADPPSLPAGVLIEALDADDDAQMRAHARIVCSGFPPPPGSDPEELIDSAARSLRHPDARGFFAIDEQGQRLAACGMEVADLQIAGKGERVLALWGTTVLEPHRRQGIQQALIAHRLRIGATAGCPVAVIESKPGIPTERNARRLGFELAYTRLIMRADS